MWRLKISQGGQFVRTCRGYLGRETWEFDEQLGSSDERATVERVREEFSLNRFDKTQSSDFLARMQLAKENNFDIMRKKTKSQNKKGGVEAAVWDAVKFLSAIQAKSGHWPCDLPGPVFLTYCVVISLYVTESFNFLLLEHQKEIRRYLYNTQNKDGGWGLHAGCSSCMLSTSLGYICLRLLGEEAENEKLCEVRTWIHDHGGATMIPSWGKVWLAIFGVYEWSGVNPLPPELFLLPFLPIHPGKLFCLVRMIFSAMSYLYAKRFVGPITQIVQSLRNELHIEPYHKIDWNQARKSCCKEDRTIRQVRYLDYFNEYLFKIYEPLFAYWPFTLVRSRALKFIENYMQYEEENSRYIWVSGLQKCLFLVSSWVRDPNSNAFKFHLARVPDFLWVGEDGMKFKCSSSQLWDAAFVVQATLACDFAKDEFGRTLKRAHDFIKDSQILENPSGDFRRYFRHITKGGWSFSTVDQQWPVSDCTSEALKALLLLSDISPDIVGEHITSERLYDGVNLLLSLQNPNGGFSGWELTRSYSWVEVFNIADFYEDTMLDYSFVECTSAAIQALVMFKERFPTHRRGEIEKSIVNAIKFIGSTQNDDGSWFGSWGLCFTYAAWFGIEALVVVGKNYENCELIRKGCHFLLSKQLSDGGWGESYHSSFRKEYTHMEQNKSNVSNTAWAMLALLKANQFERDPNPLHRAAHYLLDMQLENGDFPQQGMTGTHFRYGLMNYMMYRNIFPTWSLAEYHKKSRFSKMT